MWQGGAGVRAMAAAQTSRMVGKVTEAAWVAAVVELAVQVEGE